MKLSLFKKNTPANPSGTITIEGLLTEIRDGAHRNHVERVRQAVTDGKPKDVINDLKRELQSITISGEITGGGRSNAMNENRFIHSGLIQIDIDGATNPEAVRDMLANDPHIVCAFLSPTARGVKAVAMVETCATVEDHQAAFFTAERYYFTTYGLQIDKSTKDPVRLCYVSHDPEAKWNDSATPLQTIRQSEPPKENKPPTVNRKRELSDLAAMLAPMPERLEYDSWLRVCSGAWNEYGEEATEILAAKWREEKPGEYAEKYRNRLLDITLGTVIHQAKESGWISGSVAVKPVKKDLISFQNNDAGNAERFHSIHGENFRYHRDSGTWLRWNGIRWITADESCTQAFIMTMRAYGIQGAQIPDPLIAQAHTKHALKSCDLSRVNAAITLAKSIAGISVSSADLDNDPMIVCAQNAVIDLRTGEEIPADRSQLITKQIGTAYDKSALCPQWEAFLETVTGGDRDLIQFLQTAIGYTLTGLTTEQCLFFLYGRGQNGKGVFTTIIEALLGDYSQTAPESLFVVNRNGVIDYNSMARLVGCRLSVAAELDESAAFAESRLKSLTGSDTITGKFHYKEFFDFAPSHKFWISGNHKPAVKGTDMGIWRRLRLIPFTVTIPEGKKDKRLAEKLKAEMPGILNWAIAGCIRWQSEGLTVPSCVKRATDEYRQSEDTVGQFLDEATEPRGETAKADLYQHYVAWCDKSGIKFKLTSRRFNDRISERGDYEDARTGKGVLWRGVSTLPIW